MNEDNIADSGIKCPETVPEEQTGMTAEEEQWALKKEPRPPVPRSVFALIAVVVVTAFLGGSWWYYRTNILPEKLYQQATLLFEQEKYAEACPLYEKVLKLRLERKGVLYQIAFCKEKMGDVDSAVANYKAHLRLMPSDARAMLRAGFLMTQKNDYEEGGPLLKKGAEKLKDPYAWALVAEAALKNKDEAAAIEAVEKQAELFNEPEAVLTCGKMLMEAKAYESAIKAFDKFTKLAPDDKRGIHGAMAAKAMLGYPTEEKFLIIPGKSLGMVALGATKEVVKAAAGAPDSKIFTKVGGKSMLADANAEIWEYGRSMPKREMRVIFLNGKVKEIESGSSLYKTANGLGISNFLLPKNSEKLESRREARNSAILCLVKGGGLTFYAYGLNDAGTDASYKKLRVHKGSSSIDNVDGFSLLNLF